MGERGLGKLYMFVNRNDYKTCKMHFCLKYFLVLGSLLETELFCRELLKLRKRKKPQAALASIETVKKFLFNLFLPVQNEHDILSIGVLVPSMCVLKQR